MFNTLKNLNLKWWHTVLITISATIFILSLTVELKAFENETIAFLSSGFFFIALGSMASQSLQQGFLRSPFGDNGIVEKEIFKLSFAGAMLYLVGVFLLYKGIF